MIITNILKGIRKKLIASKQKSRFAPIPWLTERILKNEPDNLIKQRQFDGFVLNYIRPYEVVKTYKEIFAQEIYRFTAKNDSPVILDCGANIGLSCIYFKTTYPNAIVHAYEPDSKLFEVLKKNIEVNGFSKVTLHQAAIWIEDTNLSFENKGSEASHIDLSGKSGNSVKALSLASQLDQFEHIDLLKMDIEGAEFEVVQSCTSHLHKVENFFLEYHGKVNETNKLVTLLDIVKNAGFQVYIKMAADNLQSPLYQKSTGEIYDVQLNIFCYK